MCHLALGVVRSQKWILNHRKWAGQPTTCHSRGPFKNFVLHFWDNSTGYKFLVDSIA